jgi:SWIM zinc finger
MTTTSTTTDPRADRARFIASTASQWLKCHTLAGKKYGVPSQSQPGRYFLVDTRVCDCPDFHRRGGPCKHITAVRLHVARIRAEQAQREVVTAA